MPAGRIRNTRGMHWAPPGEGKLRDYYGFRRSMAFVDAHLAKRRYIDTPLVKDDFTGGNPDNIWNVAGGTPPVLNDELGGILLLQPGGGAGGDSRLDFAAINTIDKTLNPRFAVRVKPAETTQRTIRIGLYPGGGAFTQNFIWFINDAGASAVNWFAECDKAGVKTSTTTGVAADTAAMHWFEMMFDNVSGAANFFVDGVWKVAITANIPTVRLSPIIYIVNNDINTHTLRVDYYECLTSRP